MPITIVLPTPPTVGPGLPIDLSSDFVGPFPTPRSWEINVSSTSDGTDHIIGQIAHFPDLIWQTWWLSQTGIAATSTDTVVLEGADVFVQARVTDDTTGQVLDSGTATAKWSAVQGLGMQQFRAPTTITGGFTETDRQTLMGVNQATSASLPTQGGSQPSALSLLSDFIGGPPAQLLRRGETLQLSGDGSVDRPTGSGTVQAYGAVWDFSAVPPGFGFARGQVVEYDRRMAQFVVIRHDVANNEFTDQVVDVHSSFGQMRFPTTGTRGIRYSIAPGVVVAFTWLIFIVGQ